MSNAAPVVAGPGPCDRSPAETPEQMAERYGLPVELLTARVTWTSPAEAQQDDDDPESQGRQDRRTVTLGQIVDRARAALNYLPDTTDTPEA